MIKFSKGPILMGIVNVTPDSFSDGGRFLAPKAAIAHGLKLVEEGAEILDIGGESTRPGSRPVTPQEEQDRVLPVIEGLKSCGALISIDTRHAQTMQVAIKAGAGMINDVNALRGEGCLEVAAGFDGPVCLMHMRGEPQTMQKDIHYDDVGDEICGFFEDRIKACEEAGVAQNRIILDPGIGFGKTLNNNLDILKNIKQFSRFGLPILLGTSRKSFLSKINEGAKGGQRLPGSLASVLWAYQQGVQIFRVHDVAETRQAIKTFHAIEIA